MDLTPGTILAGTYRCERELGEGGTGRVVEATHLVLRQSVAVKVLRQTASPRAAHRFVREARLACRLTSAHIAKVYDAGTLEDGVPYIAMELLHGVDLAKLSRERGPLPVSEACGYMVEACAGVAEAHALGMVHRDVKLANLFLARTPQGLIVKVLDFGCVKAERVGDTSVAHATRADALLGTPRNMAPEQFASSRDVDSRADVWSLGVALYTLIAGQPPFDAETLSRLFELIVKAPVPPISRSLPAGLFDVIDRCMRKRPEDRFADAGELAIALAPYARAPARSTSKHVAIAAVAIGSMILGGSFFFGAHERARHESSSAPGPIASARTPIPIVSSSSSSVLVIADVPSSSASPHPLEKPPLPAPTFHLDVDSAYKNVDPSNEVQPAVAHMRAQFWCAQAFESDCYDIPDCDAQVTKIAFACRTAASPDACTLAGAAMRFAHNRVPNDACKLHD